MPRSFDRGFRPPSQEWLTGHKFYFEFCGKLLSLVAQYLIANIFFFFLILCQEKSKSLNENIIECINDWMNEGMIRRALWQPLIKYWKLCNIQLKPNENENEVKYFVLFFFNFIITYFRCIIYVLKKKKMNRSLNLIIIIF